MNTLTESCPGINCGASWSIPGLEGDRTFKDGLSIFWDSKELEPAVTFGGGWGGDDFEISDHTSLQDDSDFSLA